MDVFFKRNGAHSFTATQHTSGAWNPEEQHISPTLGLITHIIESDAQARGHDHLQVSRISFDIYGVVPIATYDYSVEVLRPGRTIELVEVLLTYGGRVIVRARAWLTLEVETASLAASPFPALTPLEDMEEFAGSSVWPGDYITTLRAYRHQFEPGRAHFWLASTIDLADEPTSQFAKSAALFDTANGMSVREDPRKVAYPNVELTVTYIRKPHAPVPGITPQPVPQDPVGLPWQAGDVSVSFGPTGLGTTHTVWHDAYGPFAVVTQSLTVRPLS